MLIIFSFDVANLQIKQIFPKKIIVKPSPLMGESDMVHSMRSVAPIALQMRKNLPGRQCNRPGSIGIIALTIQ